MMWRCVNAEVIQWHLREHKKVHFHMDPEQTLSHAHSALPNNLKVSLGRSDPILMTFLK